MVLGKQLFVASCFVVESGSPRFTHDFAEVEVPLLIFRQQNEVVTFDEVDRRIGILPSGR